MFDTIDTWPDKRLKNPSPEVIEFPAVLYDAKNRIVPEDPLSVFHTYVMPTEEPVLSKFCTELTGIDQEKVNAGSLYKSRLVCCNKQMKSNSKTLLLISCIAETFLKSLQDLH
jgi:inhibitor of KinA sporulation pathway (predicted exonuclease)